MRSRKSFIAAALLGSLLATGVGAAEPAATNAKPVAGHSYVQATSGSSLTFTFTQLGASSTGRFETFSTELQYDEANPLQGSLLVRVMIASVDTQDGERDDALRSPDLFDAKSHPAATYVAKSFARTASGGLEAVGRLTLRGISKNLRVPLNLEPSTNGLELSGEVTLNRLDFGVGQGDWKSTESIADAVKVQYKVALVRAPR